MKVGTLCFYALLFGNEFLGKSVALGEVWATGVTSHYTSRCLGYLLLIALNTE